jgi:hypothetical protein
MDMHDFHDCLASDACELDPGRLSFTTPSHLARGCRQRDSIILLKQLLGILVVPTLDRSERRSTAFHSTTRTRDGDESALSRRSDLGRRCS